MDVYLSLSLRLPDLSHFTSHLIHVIDGISDCQHWHVCSSLSLWLALGSSFQPQNRFIFNTSKFLIFPILHVGEQSPDLNFFRGQKKQQVQPLSRPLLRLDFLEGWECELIYSLIWISLVKIVQCTASIKITILACSELKDPKQKARANRMTFGGGKTFANPAIPRALLQFRTVSSVKALIFCAPKKSQNCA